MPNIIAGHDGLVVSIPKDDRHPSSVGVVTQAYTLDGNSTLFYHVAIPGFGNALARAEECVAWSGPIPNGADAKPAQAKPSSAETPDE